MSAMTISQEAIVYKTYLAPSVNKDGGIITIASNLKDLWSQANIASDRIRIIIVFAGEQIRGPFSRAAYSHRVDRQWQAAITRGRGYNEDRGASLTNPEQGTDPFYDKVEIYRDGFRSITTTSLEQPLDYKGIEPLSMGNMVIDGYLIKWSSAQDLPVYQPIAQVQNVV